MKAGLGDIYGNDVTYRSHYLPSGGQKFWMDFETALPAGTLKKYSLYVHNLTSAELETNVVLQIWRPNNPPFTFSLIWEQLVTVALNHPSGALYTVSVNKYFISPDAFV